jgi:hypothetical protein
MGTSDVLLWQAGIVLALMIVLGLLKHRTRKTKLHGYTKRMARRRVVAREPRSPS